MQYDNTNTGALFRNERKQTETQPDFNGTVDVEGKEYYISGWVNESKNGKKYFKLALTAKDAAQRPSNTPAQQEPIASDDIPF